MISVGICLPYVYEKQKTERSVVLQNLWRYAFCCYLWWKL